MTAFRPLALALAALTALAACNPPQLPPESLVSELRVLGIQAEPAEIGPGESTRFRALIGNPRNEPTTLLWLPCISSGTFGCASIDATQGAEDPQLMPSLGSHYTYTAQGPTFEAAWEALDDSERVEGLGLSVNLLVIREDPGVFQAAFLDALINGTEQDLEALFDRYLSDALIAIKRVQVSQPELASPDAVECGEVDAVERNRNPRSLGVLLGDDVTRLEPWVPWDVPTVEPGDEISIRPLLEEEDAEHYLFINPDGETECRREKPYFAWLADGGDLSRSYSFPPTERPGDLKKPAVWTAPLAEEWPHRDSINVWVVIRDRRGGTAWTRLWFWFGPNVGSGLRDQEQALTTTGEGPLLPYSSPPGVTRILREAAVAKARHSAAESGTFSVHPTP